MKWKISGSILASVAMLALILDAKTAMVGAQDGIELCIKVVIPSLFPFFMVSMLLCSNLQAIRPKPLKWIGQLFRMPNGAESLLVAAILGGYPAGAQAVSQAYQDGYLTRKQANRMLSYCNNAGPAFLFGMVALQFEDKSLVWLLWIIHILSAVAVANILGKYDENTLAFKSAEPLTVSAALKRSVTIMATVCGWIVIFRVILLFLDRWFFFLLPVELCVFLSGLLELSNGFCQLLQVADPTLRFVLAAGMLSFGGLCISMQTASIAGSLDIEQYLKGKALQTIISMTIALIVVHFMDNWFIFLLGGLVMGVLVTLIRKEPAKSSSIPVENSV